jgi:UDP-N-acetyl-D-mannosaminuronate dehydrogenase
VVETGATVARSQFSSGLEVDRPVWCFSLEVVTDDPDRAAGQVAGERTDGLSFERADIVLFLVDHPEFTADVVAKHSRLVLDTKGVMRETSFHGELL